MSKIIQSKVIKRGKIIDNYLVNFPQFINKEENSIYKLVIGQSITCFIVGTPEGDNFPTTGWTIRLPYYQFKQNHAQFISWGDKQVRRGDTPDFLEHTYYEPGIYEIYIIGETPELFSIFDNSKTYNESTEPYYYQIKESDKDYYCKFIYDNSDISELFLLRLKESLSEEQEQRLKYLTEKEYLHNLKTNQGLLNFMSGAVDAQNKPITNTGCIGVRELPDCLTDLRAAFKWYTNLSEIPDQPLPQQVKSCQEMFYACTNIKYIPFNFNLPEECTNFQQMFSFCTNLKMIFNQNFILPYKTSKVGGMFRDTGLQQVPLYLFNNVTSTLTNTTQMFYDCKNLLQFTTTRTLPYITNIDLMFQFCSSLRTIKFDLPNLNSLYAVCSGCYKLKHVDGFHINQNTLNAHFAFSDCFSLTQDIGEILTCTASFQPNNGFIHTFYNCMQLQGTPKEQYLWKSYEVGQYSPSTFFNCTKLENYNYITPGWGGPKTVDYWYGSYQVKINGNDEIYCLPLFKFIHGNNRSQYNLNYSTNYANPLLLTPYDFYINYGDDSAWHHIFIDTNIFFDDFWQNDKTSPFFGYPKTWKINFNSKQLVNGGIQKQTDKIHAYQNLINYNFFGYIYRDIMHIYKQPGFYKVMIMGMCPRFYVNENDYQTNRHLYSIYTINNLPFETLDHAFTNAINLRYLPNESLKEFSVLETPENFTYHQQTNTYTVEELTHEQRVTPIPAEQEDPSNIKKRGSTYYCFANGMVYDNILEARPTLFDISSGNTTFLNRVIR